MATIMWKRRELKSFEAIYEALGRVHPAERLLNLNTHLQMLKGDYDRASQIAVDWAHRYVFDPAGPITAVYLLTEANQQTPYVHLAQVRRPTCPGLVRTLAPCGCTALRLGGKSWMS
jgi:hypothetical protein